MTPAEILAEARAKLGAVAQVRPRARDELIAHIVEKVVALDAARLARAVRHLERHELEHLADVLELAESE